MLNSLEEAIGSVGVGAIVCLIWVGGMIIGGDYLVKSVGQRVGDWFSVLWFLGFWPIVFLLAQVT